MSDPIDLSSAAVDARILLHGSLAQAHEDHRLSFDVKSANGADAGKLVMGAVHTTTAASVTLKSIRPSLTLTGRYHVELSTGERDASGVLHEIFGHQRG